MSYQGIYPHPPPPPGDWNTLDHEIDPSRQLWMGGEDRHWGDCFALSTMKALSNTAEGREILANSITQDSEGYLVTFKGAPLDANNPVRVTRGDMASIPHSTGDVDTAVLEVAMEKYARATGAFGGTIGNAGYPSDAFKLLTGVEPVTGGQGSVADQIRAAGAANPNPAAVFGAPTEFENGKTEGAHAYSIQSIDLAADTVTFTNPFNSGKPITMDIDDVGAVAWDLQVWNPAG